MIAKITKTLGRIRTCIHLTKCLRRERPRPFCHPPLLYWKVKTIRIVLMLMIDKFLSIQGVTALYIKNLHCAITRAGSIKRAGRIFLQILINEQVLIASRLEKIKILA